MQLLRKTAAIMVVVVELKLWELAGEKYQRWHREGWGLEERRKETGRENGRGSSGREI